MERSKILPEKIAFEWSQTHSCLWPTDTWLWVVLCCSFVISWFGHGTDTKSGNLGKQDVFLDSWLMRGVYCKCTWLPVLLITQAQAFMLPCHYTNSISTVDFLSFWHSHLFTKYRNKVLLSIQGSTSFVMPSLLPVSSWALRSPPSWLHAWNKSVWYFCKLSLAAALPDPHFYRKIIVILGFFWLLINSTQLTTVALRFL